MRHTARTTLLSRSIQFQGEGKTGRGGNMPHNRLMSGESFKTSSFVLRPPCLGSSPSFDLTMHKRSASPTVEDLPDKKSIKMMKISPFQPVLHQRNWGGLCVVSPHHPKTAIQDEPVVEGDASTVLTQDTSIASVQHKPPVSEIRVPTPLFGDRFVSGTSTDTEADFYQSRYLSTSKDLFLANQKISALQRNNQQLQRQLFRLQCRLVQQERARPVDNKLWSVPGDDEDSGR